VKLTNWYEWSGSPFGVIDKNGKRRPAYSACRTLVTLLKGYRFRRRIELDSERDYVVELENQSGERAWCLWTSPPPGKSPDQARRHSVSIPLKLSGTTLYRVDLSGKKIQPVQIKGGSLTVTLTGAPFYLLTQPVSAME
ncbi:MAG: hypothetical protein D6820_05805, partial [Lentisphaerae bacterium]